MNADQRKRYGSLIATLVFDQGLNSERTRFVSILDLTRDELLEAYWQLQQRYDQLQEELRNAGYPSPGSSQ